MWGQVLLPVAASRLRLCEVFPFSLVYKAIYPSDILWALSLDLISSLVYFIALTAEEYHAVLAIALGLGGFLLYKYYLFDDSENSEEGKKKY